MPRLLYAVIAPLVVLVASQAAKGLDLTGHPLLRTPDGLTYRAWLPRDFSTHRQDVPLVLFSHGFGGCAQQSATLMQALADAGYAVLAPNHRDEGCERFLGNGRDMLGVGRIQPQKPFTQPGAWNAATHKNRRADLLALLDHALSHAPYAGGIDASRIAVMGHSLGGYTGLGLGGAWTEWRDPRIRAVVALSPYAAPFVAARTLGGLAVPVMLQTGTRDWGIGPVVRKGGYAMANAPKYLVVLEGASHFAWTEIQARYQGTIARYVTAFLDRHLRGRRAPLLDEPGTGQVAEYRHSP